MLRRRCMLHGPMHIAFLVVGIISGHIALAQEIGGIFIDTTEAYILLGAGLRCHTHVYDEPYSHATTNSHLQPNGTSSSEQYPYVLVGAKTSISSQNYYVAALGRYDDVFRRSFSKTKARYGSGGVYWYHVNGYAFGFSPTEKIDIQGADMEKEMCEHRLSWHLGTTTGGFSAGCQRPLWTGPWRKIIKYCTASSTGSAIQHSMLPHYYSVVRTRPVNLGTNGSAAIFTGPPIRIGSPLSIDFGNHFISVNKPINVALINAYMEFVDWVNTLGGVPIAGQLRPLEFVVIGTQTRYHHSHFAFQYLMQEEGVKFMLGPYGALGARLAAEVAEESNILVMLPGTPDVDVYQDRPTVFGVASPPNETFAIALQKLSQRGARRIGVIEEFGSDNFDSCRGVHALAPRYGMQIVLEVAFEFDEPWIPYVIDKLSNLRNSSSEVDVVLVCAEERKSSEFYNKVSASDAEVPSIVFSRCFGNPESLMFAACMTPLTQRDSDDKGQKFQQLTDFSLSWFLPLFGNIFSKIAAGWASIETLAKAVQEANSDEASDMVSALRSIDLMTVFGRVHFDDDGQNRNKWNVMQALPGEKVMQMVAPAEVARAEFVYPAPPWSFRQCFKRPRDGNICKFGIKDGACTRCGDHQSARWVNHAWPNISGGCVCYRSASCLAGHLVRGGKCEACEAGSYVNQFQNCEKCAAGYFTTSGQLSCTACPVGKFASSAGSTACTECEAGRMSHYPGSPECTMCQRGFYSSSNASSSCLLCEAGRVTVKVSSIQDEGAISCSTCPAGRFSLGGYECSECPPGKFQDAAKRLYCKDCPYGASCTGNGTVWPANKRGWWRVHQYSHTSYVSCREEGNCLEGETCKEGHTGVLCEVCLPGYRKRTSSSYCDKCADWRLQLLGGAIFAVCQVIGVFLTTVVAVNAAGKPKAISDSLLKLLFNYLTTTQLTTLMFINIVSARTRSEASHLGGMPTTNPTVVAEVAKLGVFEFFWSLLPSECLFQPKITETEQRWIDTLNSAHHSDILVEEDVRHALRKLQDMHSVVAHWRTIFWLVSPIFYLVVVLFIAFVRLLVDLLTEFRFLRKAVKFFDTIEKQGFRVASQGKSRSKIVTYFEAHNRKILGLYAPLRYFSLGQSGHVFSLATQFLHDSQPIAVIAMFLIYPTLVQMLLMPLTCAEQLPDVKGIKDHMVRQVSSPDLPCYEFDDVVFWLSIFGLFVFSVGLPFVSALIIYRNRRNVEPHFRKTWGFLLSGYESDMSFWECLLLFRKSLLVLVVSINISDNVRCGAALLTSLFFCFLHTSFRPFDNRYDQLLDRVESRHLAIWFLLCLGILWVQLEMTKNRPSDATANEIFFPAWVVVIMLCVFHVFFLLSIARQILRHALAGYAEQILEQGQTAVMMTEGVSSVMYDASTTQIDVKKKQGKKSVAETRYELVMPGTTMEKISRITRAALHQEGRQGVQIWMFGDWAARHLDDYYDTKPHLMCDHVNVWFCLGGSGSRQASVYNLQLDKISQAKMPVAYVEKPTENHARTLLFILMETFEHIVSNPHVTIITPSLLEFVLRVGYTFDDDGRARANLLEDTSASEAIRASGMTAVSSWGSDKMRRSNTDISLQITASKSLTDARSSSKKSRSMESNASEQSKSKSRTLDMTYKSIENERLREATSYMMGATMSSMGSSRSSTGLSGDRINEIVAKASSLASRQSVPMDSRSVSALMADTARPSAFEQDIDDEAQVRALVKEMFHPEVFMSGIALQDLQLNLNFVKMLSEEQLFMFLRVFDEAWEDDVLRRLSLKKKEKKSLRDRVARRNSCDDSSLPQAYSCLRRNSMTMSQAGSAISMKTQEFAISTQSSRHLDIGAGVGLDALRSEQDDREHVAYMLAALTVNSGQQRFSCLDDFAPYAREHRQWYNKQSGSEIDVQQSQASWESRPGDDSSDSDDSLDIGRSDSRRSISKDSSAGSDEPREYADAEVNTFVPTIRDEDLVEEIQEAWSFLAMKFLKKHTLEAAVIPAISALKRAKRKVESAENRRLDLQSRVAQKRVELAQTMHKSVDFLETKASLLMREKAILHGTLEACDFARAELEHLRRLLDSHVPPSPDNKDDLERLRLLRRRAAEIKDEHDVTASMSPPYTAPAFWRVLDRAHLPPTPILDGNAPRDAQRAHVPTNAAGRRVVLL